MDQNDTFLISSEASTWALSTELVVEFLFEVLCELDDGWPESETGDCQALPSKEIVKIELSKSHDIFILREKICRKREREGGCEGVTVWMCRCDIDVQMCGCVEVER